MVVHDNVLLSLPVTAAAAVAYNYLVWHYEKTKISDGVRQHNQPTMEFFTQFHWYPFDFHRKCSLIFSTTENHMTKSNVSATYYIVFLSCICVCVCVSKLKRSTYTNPMYANCIPNEFDVIIIIIMMVWTFYMLYARKTCTARTYQIDTYTICMSNRFKLSAFFALVLRLFFYSRCTPWKRCHTVKIYNFILHNNVDWDRMRKAISCEKRKSKIMDTQCVVKSNETNRQFIWMQNLFVWTFVMHASTHIYTK